jgi:hypothetical protein
MKTKREKTKERTGHEQRIEKEKREGAEKKQRTQTFRFMRGMRG